MGVKDVFRKLWMGVKVAAPYLGLAAGLATGFGAPMIVASSLMMIETLIEEAETVIKGPGTGLEKAKFVEERFLAALEVLTGKNVNNPKTRAIAARINTNVVEQKNIIARQQILIEEYKDLVKDLDDAIESAKEPSIPDDAPAPTA